MTTNKRLFCRKLVISHYGSQAMGNASPGSSRNACGYYDFYVRQKLYGERELRYPEFSGSGAISLEDGLRYSVKKGWKFFLCRFRLLIEYWWLCTLYTQISEPGFWTYYLRATGFWVLKYFFAVQCVLYAETVISY